MPTIQLYGGLYRAIQCKVCRTKIYPASALDDHLLWHKRRDAAYFHTNDEHVTAKELRARNAQNMRTSYGWVDGF